MLSKAMSTIEGRNTKFASRFKQATPLDDIHSANLTTYINNFDTDTVVLHHYSKHPIIEEIITGTDRVINAYSSMKKAAGLVGPAANFGGDKLDQAERSVFCVYASLFQITEVVGDLLDRPDHIDDSIKRVLKTTNQIRRWAQQDNQRRIDNGEESNMELIGQEIVKKCVILLHSQLQTAMNQMGVKQVTINVQLGRTRSASQDEKKRVFLKKGSKWLAVKKAVSSMSKLRTLMKLKPRSSTQNFEPETEDHEIMRVNKVLMEFIGFEMNSKQIVGILHRRRVFALARAIGLNYLHAMIKSATSESLKHVQSMVSSVYSESFQKNQTKMHYTHGIEGVDPVLIKSVQSAFFTIYQNLLNQLKITAAAEMDCTDTTVTRSFLGTFESLSFPFQDNDNHCLIELNLEESLKFLTAWIKVYTSTKDPSQVR